MADTKYTKSVSADFSSGVDAGKFDEEIRASSISSAVLLRVDVSGDVCDSWFDDPLSAGDETTFDGLVAAHDGTAQEDVQTNHEALALDTAQTIKISRDSSSRMLFKDDEIQTPITLKTLLDGTPQPPLPHKSTHEKDGSDELILQNLSAGAATDGKLLEADGEGNWTLVDYVAGIPAELNTAIDNSLSSTDSGTYQQKLRLTTSSLSSGKYFVVGAGILLGDRNNTQTEARLEEDDTTELGSLRVRLTISAAEFVYYTHAVRTLSGVHTFDLDYRFAGGSGSAQIKNATILLWKLSD